jgi:hypothetical protein
MYGQDVVYGLLWCSNWYLLVGVLRTITGFGVSELTEITFEQPMRYWITLASILLRAEIVRSDFSGLSVSAATRFATGAREIAWGVSSTGYKVPRMTLADRYDDIWRLKRVEILWQRVGDIEVQGVIG